MNIHPVFQNFSDRTATIAVVGLGYVGLPLAVSLAAHFNVLGFDISTRRIDELSSGKDKTGEVEVQALKRSGMRFTANPEDLKEASLIIVAVPTPIDDHKKPDLSPVLKASQTVGAAMSRGTVVVYESTVYPGVTEDECIPLLEKASGFVHGKDFFAGYSPERINPGDKVHTVDRIVKVVAGSTPETLELLASVYGTIVTAGIHKASSIKVAEAAKVIENTQRDLNIALMNELSIIFNRLGIDTLEVLAAAGTKWNFLPFRPGLVGGHCIGVDPYYLTYKAEETGYHPEVILAGRRINDTMGKYIARTALKMLIQSGNPVKGSRVGIFGLTFKENVPDLRNTRVVDIMTELKEFGINVLISDPLAEKEEAEHEYGIRLLPVDEMINLDAIIVAVGHEQYAGMDLMDFKSRLSTQQGPFLDIKGLWNPALARAAGMKYWRL